MTNDTKKISEKSPDGCTLGCAGLILGMLFWVLSMWLVDHSWHDEYGPIDRDGDYVLYDSGRELPTGTWKIENPYYFVHNAATVNEMENWRQTKLIVSDDGTFDLIQPTALLAKILLVSDMKTINRESFCISDQEATLVHNAMQGSISGQWSQQTDDKDGVFFRFSATQDELPQRIRMANVSKDSVKSGRLEDGVRLHWSIFSHVVFPKEGMIWKKVAP